MINSEQIKKVFKYLIKRKYILTLGFFVLWLGLFDKNSIITNIQNRNKLNKLKQEKEFWIDKITKDSTSLYELKTDDKNLEKYARQQYLMHKPNEEVFLTIEEN